MLTTFISVWCFPDSEIKACELRLFLETARNSLVQCCVKPEAFPQELLLSCDLSPYLLLACLINARDPLSLQDAFIAALRCERWLSEGLTKRAVQVFLKILEDAPPRLQVFRDVLPTRLGIK